MTARGELFRSLGEGAALTRRDFLSAAFAGAWAAALSGCRKPLETIVPYADDPEHLVPGRPLFYASALRQGRAVAGVLVESHMGRPTKVESLPGHPDGPGGAWTFAQAAVRGLCDPGRSQAVLRRGAVSTWKAFREDFAAALSRAPAGRGLRLLTGLVTSPALAELLVSVERRWPGARWHQYDAAESAAPLEGARLVFGRALWPRWDLGAADVLVALESDLLAAGPGWPARAAAFAARRRARRPGDAMSRLYAVESSPSLTGAAADHRLPLRSGDVDAFARELARALGLRAEGPELGGAASRLARAAAADLRRAGRRGLVVAGDGQPAAVHALAHQLNARLGGAGPAVRYGPPPEVRPGGGADSLRELAEDMAAGKVSALLILGGNPAYDAPADLDFAERLGRVPWTARLGLHADETARRCLWHVPEAHELEAWGDARCADGTVSLAQPLIAPLYGGRSALDVAGELLDPGRRDGHALLRARWGAGGEAVWRRMVHDGLVPGTADATEVPVPGGTLPPARRLAALEVTFRPDPALHDGRHAGNPWLQELPRPFTGLVWDNAAWLSPADAARLALASGDVVELGLGGRAVEAPVWVVPGQAEGSVALHLGYGRLGAGFDAGRLRGWRQPWRADGLALRRLGRRTEPACVQGHHAMEGRDLARSADLAAFAAMGARAAGAEPSLHPPRGGGDYAWAMAIDLGACLGCMACVAACQAENNIPPVGRDEARRGRELHWLRVDTYAEGPAAAPRFIHQPVPCMHCEQAPCEPVCPVGATVHGSEGLNEMVYNRCVGTRYCGNNCPYKVRRFNFFAYAEPGAALELGRNPDVSVRERGVMEKCTYCVQRISAARIAAKKEGRRLRDGEVVTACQAACPTSAIVFGDRSDPRSRVARELAAPQAYGLLEELGTRPRTRYLARLRNPNPELGDG